MCTRLLKRGWPLLLPLCVAMVVGSVILLNRALGNPPCAVWHYWGVHCPGCGGTRCAADLMSGNWLAAMGHNVLLGAGLFAFVLLFLYLFIRVTLLDKPTLAFPRLNGWWIWGGIGGVILFAVLRNLPWAPFTWLAP